MLHIFQEFLDVYRANNWDAKDAMIELGKMSKERKQQSKLKRMEAEMMRKKQYAEKKESKKMEKTSEKELESLAKAAMKEKIKAQRASWKGKIINKKLQST